MSQIPDIVARLRESGSQDCIRGEPWRSQVKDEAADTITQLRERLEQTTKEREEALGYEIRLRAERDQLRLSNERLREALKAWQKFDNSNLRNYPITVLIDNQQNARAITAAALTAESGTEIDPTHPKGE